MVPKLHTLGSTACENGTMRDPTVPKRHTLAPAGRPEQFETLRDRGFRRLSRSPTCEGNQWPRFCRMVRSAKSP